MLEYGLSLALISSALDEVNQNPELLKTSEAADTDERELLEYLTLHGEELHKWATELFQAWYIGLEKRAAEHNAKPDELIKQAVLGLDLPWWAEIPATAGYFVPGVGTAMFGADAARHFYKMFGKGMDWKQRLAQGLYGGLNVGAAGLSLFGLGGLAKSPKLLGLLARLGKPGAYLASKLPTASQAAAKYVQTAAGAAKPGVVGRAARMAGYSPKAKAGWMHNLINRLRGVTSPRGWTAAGEPAPGIVGRAARVVGRQKAYISPYQRLGIEAAGGRGRLNFPWLRYEAAAAPIGVLAGGGAPAAAAATAPVWQQTPRWSAPVIRATPREFARWRA